MTDSPNLGLPYLEASQAQKHVTHNEALRRLDALVQAAVIDRTLTAPPVSPADGESYIPAAGATGAWAGHALEIASWQDGAWAFFPPAEGWQVWSAAEDALLAWNGTAWIVTGGAALINPAPLVGVNTTADTTNRLAVSSPASLFNHEGNGHQLKINKNADTDTASLLYQTGFSGRAEMGTAGDDDFHIKVSADGSAWNEAMVVDRTTGEVSFPNTTFGGGGVSDGDKGDLSVTGSGTVWTIDADAVTNAKLADMATATFKGRTTAGTGNPEDLTATQATALLDALVGDSGLGGTKGLAPAPAAGDAAANKFLKASGAWAVPAGSSPGGADTQIQYNDGGAFNGSADFTFDETTSEVAIAKWLRLAEQASDPADPSNGNILFSKKLAERRLPRFGAPLGLGSFLQPFLGTQKVAYWTAGGNSTTAMTNIGAAALTNVGTLTARNVATTNILTRTRRLGLVSAATAGSVAGPRNALAQWTVGNGSGLGGLFFSAIFNISDGAIVTAGRLFVGMQAATGAPTDVEPSALVNCFGVGCNSSHTNLHIFHGGSAAQTPVSLGASFPCDTTSTDLYRVCFFTSPDENAIIYYEVTRLNTGDVATGTISGTVGTQVPASTTLLTANCYRSNGGVASAVGVDFSIIYIETEQ